VTDAQLLTRWIVAMALIAVVVVLVVALLLMIIVAARGILAAAVRCLGAVEKIRANVEPLWALETTNQVAEKLVGGAQSIEGKARLLADAVEAHDAARAGTGV